MSDQTPVPPAAVPATQEAAPAAAPVAAAPAPAPAAAAKPPYVNPWQGRAPVPPATAPAAPSAPPAPPSVDPRVDALMSVLGETVAQDMSTLPANVVSAVRALAPDTDPVAQRRAINAMRANGLATPPSTNAAPLPPPASTVMPQPSAVTQPASPASDDASVLAEYEKLAKVAPTIANAYRVTHSASITRALAARTPAN